MQKLFEGTATETFGPANAPVVVLIHGLGLCRDVWQWQVPDLAKRFRVITYDLYGHAESSDPLQTPSLTLFSNQLLAVLDGAAASKAAIVGFSLGGMIARRFAQDHPDRVSALVILHSPHKRTPDAQDAILKRVEQAKNEGSGATVEAALDRWFTKAYRDTNPDMMELVRRWVLANDIAVYHRNYRVLADGIDEIVAPTPAINTPTLVVTGDEDFGNGPEMTQAIAKEIHGAETLILKGLRHMALAEDPEALNLPIIAFLERHLEAVPS